MDDYESDFFEIDDLVEEDDLGSEDDDFGGSSEEIEDSNFDSPDLVPDPNPASTLNPTIKEVCLIPVQSIVEEDRRVLRKDFDDGKRLIFKSFPQGAPKSFLALRRAIGVDSMEFHKFREIFINFRVTWLCLSSYREELEFLAEVAVIEDLLLPSLLCLALSFPNPEKLGSGESGIVGWIYSQIIFFDHSVASLHLSKTRNKFVRKCFSKALWSLRTRWNNPSRSYVVLPYSAKRCRKGLSKLDGRNNTVCCPIDAFTWFK